MQINIHKMREGYDGKRCLVHARMCATPDGYVATAQYLDVTGCDSFDGIKLSTSSDGIHWSEFVDQPNLAPIRRPDGSVAVGCDGTPMYHKKTDTVLILGHTALYESDAKTLKRGGYVRSTFYSTLKDGAFTPIRFVEMPPEYTNSGNGCGQSLELEDGTLLIPIYYSTGTKYTSVTVMHCSYDGETVRVLEIGNGLCIEAARGIGEPSIIFHGGKYHLTIRHDDNGYYSVSDDGLHFTAPQLWRWDDGEILPNYNTQQHWLTLGSKLYLVYTRRGVNNDHVFRHRAPLLIAEARDGILIRETEQIITPERGARMGNFGACQLPDGRAAVMAAEWMQPIGCEKYGSANAIWLSYLSE